VPKIRVTVAAESSSRAQHLVAELIQSGCRVEPFDGVETDRSVFLDMAKEAAIVFFVHGTYDAVKGIVSSWRKKEQLAESQVSVDPEGDSHDPEPPED
jgi:hypothetical protein